MSNRQKNINRNSTSKSSEMDKLRKLLSMSEGQEIQPF